MTKEDYELNPYRALIGNDSRNKNKSLKIYNNTDQIIYFMRRESDWHSVRFEIQNDNPPVPEGKRKIRLVARLEPMDELELTFNKDEDLV